MSVNNLVPNRCASLVLALAAFLAPTLAHAVDPDDIIVTEIMNDPSSTPESRWEWIEIKNTTGGAIDLNDWVVGDIASRFDFANISDSGGSVNTIVPADGVAVLYNGSGSGLGSQTERFTDAWGSGIQLIPVGSWPALNNGADGDRVGLWSDHASYGTNGMPENEMVPPNWASAIFELNYASNSIMPRTR